MHLADVFEIHCTEYSKVLYFRNNKVRAHSRGKFSNIAQNV